MLRLELILHLRMVPFLEVREVWRSGAARARYTLTLTPSSHTHLEHGLWEVPVEEPHHILYVLAAFGPYSDHVAISKPGGTLVWSGALCGLTAHPSSAPHLTHLFLRCWMLPRQRSRPFTMMASRVHRASHSSMLWTDSTGWHQRDCQRRWSGGVGEGHTCVTSAPPNVLS